MIRHTQRLNRSRSSTGLAAEASSASPAGAARVEVVERRARAPIRKVFMFLNMVRFGVRVQLL